MAAMRLRLIVLLSLLAAAVHGGEPFKWRGYYLTFMRMPVMGLPEWKEAIDCFSEDGVNIVVLWMGGGFRSKKFPITWQYNEEHANVRRETREDREPCGAANRRDLARRGREIGFDL